MSNTHIRTLLKQVTITALLLGILTVATATQSSLQANLTGGGATALMVQTELKPAPEQRSELQPAPEELHGAAGSRTERARSAQRQLILGMALVLLGFCLHYVSIKLFGQERRVPVHGVRRVSLWYERSLDTELPDFRWLSAEEGD